MKTLRLAVLIVASLALPACYDFNFPLDPLPSTALETRLNGAWNCLAAQADSGDAPGTLRVERRSDTVARWTFSTLSGDGAAEKSEYDVHGSTVKGGPLLNALELGSGANGKWNLVRYSFLLPDVLRLQVVNDEVVGPTKDAAALRAVIEKRVDDPAIYTDLLVCVRAKPARAAGSLEL